MCMFSQPDIPAPQQVPERAATKLPDKSAAQSAGQRQEDIIRAGTNTILTSGSGVTTPAQTQGKTLLGQ